MKLSIILPCYNIPDEYFKSGVESLLNQTFRDFELIIVDDCSPNPENIKYIKSIMAKDARIKLIQNNPNQGAAESRNIGLGAARGEYIAFFDGDDYVEHDYYEKLIITAEANNADMVMCGFKRVDNNGKILKTRDQTDTEADVTDDNVKALQFSKMSYALWNKLYKRELIKDIKFPKGVRLAEDVEFNFQAFLKSQKSTSVSNNFYYYRNNPGSVTNIEKDGSEAIRTNIIVTGKLLAVYSNFPMGKKLKKAVEKYLLFRFVRYANKFGRLKNAENAEQLWSDYKKLFRSEFAIMQKIMPFRYKILKLVFGENCSRSNLKIKVSLLRLICR